MTHRRVLALIAVLAVAALPASPASAWTPAQPIGTAPDEFYELRLGFNARGDALLAGSGGYITTTAVRPAGRAFGPLRTSKHAEHVAFREPPVLGMDRGALLLGDWDDPVEELAAASHGDCCERAGAVRLSPGGRLSAPAGLTPRGTDGYVSTVWPDERGAAGISMQVHPEWSITTRTRAGALAEPRPVPAPADGTIMAVAVRPNGHGIALWTGRDSGLHHGRVRPDGTIASDATVAYLPPGERFTGASLLRGRGGQIWALYGTITDGMRERRRAAPLNAHGDFRFNRRLPSGDRATATAVDDEGALHLLWRDGRALRTASVLPDRRFGRVRTVARGRITATEIAAGPRGRTAFAWETEPSRGVNELWTANGHRTRVGKPVRVARLTNFEDVDDSAIGISRSAEALLAWQESGSDGEPARFRYSTRRLP